MPQEELKNLTPAFPEEITSPKEVDTTTPIEVTGVPPIAKEPLLISSSLARKITNNNLTKLDEFSQRRKDNEQILAQNQIKRQSELLRFKQLQEKELANPELLFEDTQKIKQRMTRRMELDNITGQLENIKFNLPELQRSLVENIQQILQRRSDLLDNF